MCGGLRPETASEAKAKRAKWADRGHAPAGASATAHRQAASARQFGDMRPVLSCSRKTLRNCLDHVCRQVQLVRAEEKRRRRRALEGTATSVPGPTEEGEQDASNASDPSAVSSKTSQEHLQRRIRAIYAGIPQKTPEEVDAILSRFNGRERELLDKMESKYQLPSTEPAGVEYG